MSNRFLKLTCLLPPAEIGVLEIFHSFYFINLYYFRTEKSVVISVSIISFLTVFLKNLYSRWLSFYKKVIEII